MEFDHCYLVPKICKRKKHSIGVSLYYKEIPRKKQRRVRQTIRNESNRKVT